MTGGMSMKKIVTEAMSMAKFSSQIFRVCVFDD